jgi:hypothetical protein
MLLSERAAKPPDRRNIRSQHLLRMRLLQLMALQGQPANAMLASRLKNQQRGTTTQHPQR